jgi:parvulin-like peptidyl-prolyl isomerase
MAGLGFAAAVAAEAFRLTEGQVSERLLSNDGYAVIALAEIKPSALPTLEDAKTRVRDDVIVAKALETATSRAASVSKAAGANFAAAVKAAGGRLVTTDVIARGSTLPEIGVNKKVEDALFALKAGEITAPVSTGTAVVVGRLVSREEMDPKALEAERESVREQLTRQRRGDFFAAYMEKAKSSMRIDRYDEVIAEVLQ